MVWLRTTLSQVRRMHSVANRARAPEQKEVGGWEVRQKEVRNLSEKC